MDYFKTTQSFIEDCNKTTNLHDLASLVDKFTKSLGCINFVCLSHVNPFNPPEDAVVLTNYPLDWVMHHGDQEYHRYDPIMETCKSRVVPFEWSDTNWRYNLTKGQTEMLGEAAEFGLINGYTVPIPSSTGYAASLSIVYQEGTLDPDALPAIHLLSYYVYEKALALKSVHRSIGNQILTDKQRFVLEEISRGKSNWVISKGMGVSESAIKKHVKNIFHKYGVASRQQAIVRGLFSGDINYCDVISRPTPETLSQPGFVHIQS